MNETNKNELTPNMNYKDTMFRLLFKEKSAALSLYNALNQTDYENEDELEIVTLENAIYINVKNDLAFVLDSSLNLYEHQSTYNPNMPLRDLIYVAKEFQKLIDGKSLYTERPVELPYPKFVVFYNGSETKPEKEILKLSDLYNISKELKNNPELELKVMVLNINKGYNEDLKKKCPLLLEYMQYVDRVRYYKDELKNNLQQAVEYAINDCLKSGVLEKFLRKNRAEVLEVSIFEYNAEEELRKLRLAEREYWQEYGLTEGRAKGLEEGRAEGFAEGQAEGRAEGQKSKSIFFILTFLKELGDVPQTLENNLELLDETSLDELVMVASKATSIDEFMKCL